MRVMLVLRTGGDFKPEHVGALARQIEQHLPGADIACLSDVDVPCQRIPLQHDWPGWFAKMELFRPDIDGTILYMDLDTVIVGDLSEIASVARLTMLSDFYKPKRPASGVMLLPEQYRAEVWRQWTINPARSMAMCGTLGDQLFIGKMCPHAQRWQDVVPGQIVSYKAHVRAKTGHRFDKGNGNVPSNARIICFHGKPRPWDVGEFDFMYR